MPPCVLDTNILKYLLQGHFPVVQRAREHNATYGSLYITILTYYEVVSGWKHKASSPNREERRQARNRLTQFEDFCARNIVLPLTIAACQQAATAYAELRNNARGYQLGLDILIAGIALERGFTLVTDNTKDFSGISGLTIENWLA